MCVRGVDCVHRDRARGCLDFLWVSARTTRGLRIATRCASLDQFVAAFNRFCDAQTCFISTLTMRPVGLETAFSIDLATGAPALRGLGVVIEAWSTPGNRFGRPGLMIGIRKLTADSERVFERLLAAHVEATPPPMPPPTPPVARAATASMASLDAPLPLPQVVPDGERTPGSELVLPANPLMNISDHSLGGFVDCTLYEETGNFFPAPEPDAEPADAVAEPPVLAARRVTIPPIAEPRTVTGPMTPLAMPLPFEPRTITGPMMPFAAMPPPLPAMPTPVPMIVTPPPIPMPLTRPTIRRDSVAPPVPEMPAMPPRHDLALQPRRAPAMTWPPRRIAVAGGVAVATIAIAIAVAARSGHAHVAESASTPPQLMAANSPAPTRMTAPQAAVPPSTVADVAPANAPDDPGDTGGAPTFGTGPCKIAVSTTPAGSIVTVDGEVAGPSPITIGGACGKRKLDIAHPRYAPATRVVTATPDPAPVDVALARPTHDLYVETTPPGAIVSIDGHRAGTSPTLVKVMGFTTLTLHIEKFGFAAKTEKIYSKTPHDRVAIRLGH
jgi:hypothetical protein